MEVRRYSCLLQAHSIKVLRLFVKLWTRCVPRCKLGLEIREYNMRKKVNSTSHTDKIYSEYKNTRCIAKKYQLMASRYL